MSVISPTIVGCWIRLHFVTSMLTTLIIIIIIMVIFKCYFSGTLSFIAVLEDLFELYFCREYALAHCQLHILRHVVVLKHYPCDCILDKYFI